MKNDFKILIQHKIDGTLSDLEEAQFTQLIERSAKARNLYRKLLLLDYSLKANADEIGPIDLSEEVMRSIQPNMSLDTAVQLNRLNGILLRRNLLKVAAVLLFGFLVGGATIYFAMNNENVFNRQAISGTLSIIPEAGNTVYSEKDTQIKVYSITAAQLFLTVISIDTEEMIECRIADDLKVLNNENIVQLSDGDGIEITHSENQKIVCTCNGPVVFQIRTLKGNKLALDFLRDKKEIANTMIN
jgi:hypothetical protein